MPEFPLRADPLQLREGFDSEHARLTGHSAPTEAVEIVNYRVTGVVAVPQAPLTNPFAARQMAAVEQALLGKTDVYFTETPTVTPVYDRTKLPAGATLAGPAILLQADTTIVLHEGERATVDAALGHLEIVLIK